MEHTNYVCPHCGTEIDAAEFAQNSYVCVRCSHHKRLSWRERLACTVDKGSFAEFDAALLSANPLGFEGYDEKIAALRKACGTNEAVVTGACTIQGEKAVIGVMDTHFMMGSMGSVVGEKIARAFERAAKERLPVVLFCASGGARMQEGMLSLMQMAKTAGAARRHADAGLLYVSVMTDPTTGGVTASFASLGGVVIAEPGALVGFAGKRVIQDTIGESLPDHFQSAEFLLRHGFADMLVNRPDIPRVLHKLFCLFKSRKEQMIFLSKACDEEKTEHAFQKIPLKKIEERLSMLVSLKRPSILDYIPLIFDDFLELKGDRCYGDDPAVLGGVALFQGQAVMLISHVRGRDIEEFKNTNFSMPHPEGYRKALRLAKQAECFAMPVICFIDTTGAFCGIGAEERGQGAAIAECLAGFMMLKTPVISVVLGNGGSGGALAIGVCDRLAMLENSLYSVISPRGFASILWKDAGREKEAAAVMKITAEDLRGFGICDDIIPEPTGGAHTDIPATARDISRYMAQTLAELLPIPIETLLENRFRKYRESGVFHETIGETAESGIV